MPHGAVSRTAGLGLAFALACSVFLADQSLKRFIESSMRLGESIPLIPNVLHFTYIRNEGGAFGILGGQASVLLLGSVIAVGLVLYMLLQRAPTHVMVIGCGLILGGAAGNLLDRLSAGEVTDYVDIRVWPIFNTADVAIVLGVATLLLSALGPKANQRSATGKKPNS
ncbi:MAG: signal peptidase II [Rubrobacter sp.]|nr:signal peptidase II [Rubrobacter sp.]